MSDAAHSPAIDQRFLPRDRESFLDAQRRNRRATWRLSALCVLAAVVMGIPLALIVTPLLYAVALIAADIINIFSPLPPALWAQRGPRCAFWTRRAGLVASAPARGPASLGPRRGSDASPGHGAVAHAVDGNQLVVPEGRSGGRALGAEGSRAQSK